MADSTLNNRRSFTPLRAWGFGFVLVFVISAFWEFANNLPPSWDMAHHQLLGIQFYDAFSSGLLLDGYTRLTSYYPPLYYLLESLVILVFGDTQFLALFSNLPGIFLLSFFTFRTAEKIMPSSAAVSAGLLVILFPMVAWTSRVSLLDTGLAGWVAFAFYLIIRSDFLENRNYTLLFGLVCATGTLYKWTFPFFLIVAVLYALAVSSSRKKAFLNLCLAAVIALPIAATWYWPNAANLLERIRMTAEAGSQFEQDPGLSSLWGWIYYVRCLSGYYLFLPLSILLGIALFRLRREYLRNRILQMAAINLLGSILIMTLLEMKDPRYIMPAAPFLALLLVAGWKDSPLWSQALIPALAIIQMLLVSFPLPGVPEKIALFEVENDSSYKGMNYEWVLFETSYFGILGTARDENWRLEEIIENFHDGDTVAVVPEHPYFNTTTMALYAYRRGLYNLRLSRVGMEGFHPEILNRADWILGKSGEQGVEFLTRYSAEVYSFLAGGEWPIRVILGLPDGSRARIWQNPEK